MLLMEVLKCWKVVEFQLKWKILKHFTSSKQRTALRKFFSPQPDKSFLLLWNKDSLAEIHRGTKIFAFQELRKYSSLACSANVFSDINVSLMAVCDCVAEIYIL